MNELYQVVQAGRLFELEAGVRTLIREGWRPTGGIFIINRRVDADGNFDDNGREQPVFYQSMVR